MIGTAPGRGPRVLVAFATRHGATREIAASLAEHLRRGRPGGAAPHVVLAPVQRCPDPAGFDAVVLGSALYGCRWLEPARRFAETTAPQLRDRTTWLFSSGLAGPADRQRDDDAGEVGDLVGARGSGLFPGRLERRLLTSAERHLWGTATATTGDFRDWSAVRRWSEQITADLLRCPSTPVGV
jgi:menaquinone-dependent protoporphyrinogen oxidase